MTRKRDTIFPDPIFQLPEFTVEQVMLALSQQVDWGLSLLGVPKLWTQTRGKGVRVAVLDTGIAMTHPDLVGQIEDAVDFTRSRSGPADMNGHGTHTAGTIAAKDDTGGVVGIANESKLLIGKVLGDNGSGTSEMVANGITWAVEAGADVISMSLGAPMEAPQITNACKYALSKGVPIIAAAGNEGPGQNTTGYPASLPFVISVGAFDQNKKIAMFSSRGKVDVACPGVKIISCYPPRGVAVLSGTSMSAPFCTGVVALMIAKHKMHGGNTPVDTPEQVMEHLKRAAIDAGAPGKDAEYGWGILSPEKLLEGEEPPNVPDKTLTVNARGYSKVVIEM